jgi:hypothetical protein
MYENLPFNLQRDIAPVSGLIDYPMVMAAHVLDCPPSALIGQNGRIE